MRTHDVPILPPGQHEDILHFQRVDAATLGLVAVRAEEERIEHLSESEANGDTPLASLREKYADNESEASRNQAIDEARAAVGSLTPSQRKLFDRHIGTNAPSHIRRMRESTASANSRRETVPSWSSWLAGETQHGATDDQMLEFLRWNVHSVGELQTYEPFEALATDTKRHFNDSMEKWASRGLITVKPRPERIERAKVVVGDMVSTAINSDIGRYAPDHDPNAIVVSQGVGRTPKEQFENIQDKVHHTVLHELGHYGFKGFDEFWLEEPITEFMTVVMDGEEDVLEQRPESHIFFIDNEGYYPELMKHMYVLLTKGRSRVEMPTVLRAHTSMEGSKERMVFDRELDAAWGVKNMRQVVNGDIGMLTQQYIQDALARSGREGPGRTTIVEFAKARKKAVETMTDRLADYARTLRAQ